MRTVVIALGLVCLMGAIRAQNVGIGTSTPDPSARLDVSDTRRGILIPRLTTAERNAIPNPAHSLLIYNTTCNEYQYYISGTGWVSIPTNVTAGSIGPITAFPATGISASGFTAHWSPVAGATSYEVRVYQDCGSSTVVATATFPAGSTSGPISVSMPCGRSRCYEVRAIFSNSNCGTVASLLISNRVPIPRSGSDPCTTPNTWVSLPAPPATMQGRTKHVTIAHGDFVYVGFGRSAAPFNNCHNDWWRWEACFGTWTQLASPPVNFGSYPIIFAIGPYIYVGGGAYQCGGPIASFYRYDPATNTWTPRASLPVPLWGAAGASDGTYGYVAAGRDATGSGPTNALYRYDPTANSWTQISSIPGNVGRERLFMAYYQGKLYIGGGWTGSQCRKDFYAYDIQTGNWTRLADHPSNNEDYEGWTEGWAVAYNGKIYVTGQVECGNICTNQFYSYDIASNAWSLMPVFPGGRREGLKLVELGEVLYGGWGVKCFPPPRNLPRRLVGILPVMGEDRAGALGHTALRSA
jgi:N-acetylneuraminic acid mutarotase